MSMNLYVEGTRNATVVVKGVPKVIVDRTKFDLWQTPTEVTFKILELAPEMRFDAYAEWVHQACHPYIESVFAEDDPFAERGPVGELRVDPAQEHLEELHRWLVMCDEEDYKVTLYTM